MKKKSFIFHLHKSTDLRQDEDEDLMKVKKTFICQPCLKLDDQGDFFRGMGFGGVGGWSGSGGGGFGLASFLSVSGRGPLFSSRKRHFQK